MAVDAMNERFEEVEFQRKTMLFTDSREAAVDYARSHGIKADVTEPKPRALNIRPRGYGENFATDRRGAWTH